MAAKTSAYLSPAEIQALAAKHPTALRGVTVRKEFIADEVKAVSEDERTIRFTISTGGVDRDRDIINPAGWKFDNYRKNPVILFGHDYRSLPVAKTLDIRVEDNRVSALAQFATADLNPFADTVYRMVKAGFLNASSVGFRPVEWVYNEERRGVDYLSTELLEFSVVPIPAHPEALVEARSAGIDLAPLKAWAERILFEWDGEPGLYVPKDVAQAVFRIAAAGANGATAGKTVAGQSAVVELDGMNQNLPPGESDEADSFPAKPYPNEHACRLQDPGKFDRFRRGARDHEGRTYSVIFGHPKAGGGWEEQAYRYPKGSWSPEQARSHCRSHDGMSFEPASGEAGVCASCQDDVLPSAKRQFTIVLAEPSGKGSSVVIDGKDITNTVQSLSIKAAAGELTEIILDTISDRLELSGEAIITEQGVSKRGRVLSSANEMKLRAALKMHEGGIEQHQSGLQHMREVLAQVESQPAADAADPAADLAKEEVVLDLVAPEPLTLPEAPAPATLELDPAALRIAVVESVQAEITRAAATITDQVAATLNRLRGRVD